MAFGDLTITPYALQGVDNIGAVGGGAGARRVQRTGGEELGGLFRTLETMGTGELNPFYGGSHYDGFNGHAKVTREFIG